jgi:HEAT repeat protein
MRFFILSLSLALCGVSLVQGAQASLEQSQKRIKDHLLIKDYTTALSELKIYLAQFPQSKELQALMVRTLAESGLGVEAFKQWNYAVQLHHEIKEDLSLIEGIAWSILDQAETSSQYIVNISSMIGASLTHDAKAVRILQRYLRSSNAYLRMIAVQLSAQYGDKVLIQEIEAMLHKESAWYVRLEVIKALGRFHCEEVTTLLKEMLANKRSTLEEMAAAAEALVIWYDDLEEQELAYLLKSKRAGLRYLACEIIAYLNCTGYSRALASLLEDTSAEVRMAALNTLSVIGMDPKTHKEVLTKVEILTQDPHSYVAITACRLLMFYHHEHSGDLLRKWIEGEDPDLRRVAAAALARSGAAGRNLAMKLLNKTHDPFVRVNLAYGMIGYEEHEKSLCLVIAEFLEHYSENIMIDVHASPLLKVIAPSQVRHTPGIAQYPTAVDQHIRLHLLNLLAMMRYPDAGESIKKYLKAQHFGLTYTASTALIEEGAEDSLQIIKALLTESDEKIRVQAALVLALLGGDIQAVEVLQEAYPHVDRELKMQILEALGHIGSRSSIPFLMKLMDDPFNVMRTIAASAIIQCIYH